MTPLLIILAVGFAIMATLALCKVFAWSDFSAKQDQEIDYLRKALDAVSSNPAPPRTVPALMMPALTEDEMAHAFARVNEHNALWQAIHQRIAENIARAVDRAADKKTAEHPGTMAHANGGMSWLLDLRDELLREAEEAQRLNLR